MFFIEFKNSRLHNVRRGFLLSCNYLISYKYPCALRRTLRKQYSAISG